jgi:hypothetical protein
MLDFAKLSCLTPSEFAALGFSAVAYLKRVDDEGAIAYAAYAADGTYLSHFHDRDEAVAMLREHDLEPVSLQ